ncbi:MAG: hypothetical protein P8R54_19580, partial [Myxococcota bacterium]|nr:hypothetical protein [Myxococcota bacterium]
HLKAQLFRDAASPPALCSDADTSVRCVSTPDDMREMNEVARTVQAAIQQGTALDRIAVVLPQTSGAEALAAALRRSAIPATWMTGAPLIGEPCARFLWLALSLTPGGAVSSVVASWYDLLTQPGLMGLPRAGRGRWRRMLSECPQGLSVLGMVGHFTAIAGQAGEDGNEREEIAATVLADAIARVQRHLEALPESASLHEHAACWRRFMEHWWRPGLERDRLLQAVDAWGGGDREMPLPQRVAAQLLVDELRQVQKRSGSLTQPKIRILPPMGLLGGAFDLVCVTGLSDGCFPRRPRETALLTDAMALRLQEHGAPVLTTAETHEVERRRFGAVVAACEGALWLSVPRTELLEGTPQLPGTLLMAALSCLAGRRVLFRDLPTLLTPQGSRARPLPKDPDAALGTGEFLVARAARTPAAALGPLVANPTTHRLLSFHRAIDRLRTGVDTLPNAWTGAVPLTLLSAEAIQQEALSPEALSRLVLDPAGYFWRDVLGVWRARSLRRPRINMTQSGIARQVLQLVLEAFSTPEGDPEARFVQLWEDQLQAAARQLGVQDAGRINTWRILGQRAHAELVQSHHAVLSAAVTAPPDAPVVAGVPLRVIAEPTPLHNGKLVIPSRKPPGPIKISNADGFVAMTQGYAVQAAGEPVDVVRLLAGNGQFRDGSLDSNKADYQAQVQRAWERTQAGWWPITSASDPFALAAEREAAGGLAPETAAAIVDSLRMS